jgi:hypothetical protein
MNKTIRHVPDNALLALYLALRAARSGAQRVYVTNDALKAHLRKQKVHKPQIHKFAGTLKTVFPNHSIGKEHYKLKNGLFLYFTKEQFDARLNKDVPTERIRRIPSQKEIDDALSVQTLDLPK